MEGNVVKAAYVLGGSILLSVILFGSGALVAFVWFAKASANQADLLSQRAADAVIEAPKHVRVALDAGEPIKATVAVDASAPLRVALDTSTPFKVGFENKLPMALRLENSMDEEKGTRAPLVLKLNP